MNKRKNIKFLTIVFAAIIVIICWSLLEGWIPLVRRKWLFLAVGIILSIPSAMLFFRTKQSYYVFFYLIILLINVWVGDEVFPNIGEVFFEVFALLFPALLSFIMFNYYSNDNIKIILFAFFFVLMFTAVSSFYIDRFLLPNAIRAMTRYSITMKDMDTVYAFYRMGLSTYSFPHSLPVLIPALVLGVKMKNLKKIVRIIIMILLIADLLLVWLSGIMTALLLAILFLFISLLTQFGSVRKNILRISIITILFLPLFNQSVLLGVTQTGKSLVGDDSFYYTKLDDFETELIIDENSDAGGGDWNERQNLYSQSISAYIENSLVGTDGKVGNHSTFLDRLGSLGLLGFVPFVLFVFIQLRYNSRMIAKKYRLFYYEGCMAGLLMLALKSAFSAYIWIVLFAILPFTIYVLTNEKASQQV